MSDHTKEQRIPVVSDAALVALFDAALAAKPWDVVLSATYMPDAGTALISWAKSRDLRVVESRHVTETDAYANVVVNLLGANDERGNATITVLGYRKLTADEIAAITVETRKRSDERICATRVAL